MSSIRATQPLRLACVLIIGVVAQSLVACAPKSATAGSAGAPTTPTLQTAASAPATPTRLTAAGAPTTPTTLTAAGAPTTPTTLTAPVQTAPEPTNGATGAEAAAGDEPSVAYVDSAGLFSFQYPKSWGKATPPGESIRYIGRDEFINIKIVDTTLNALDFARSDASALAAASPGYQAKPLVAYKVAGTSGAMVAYTWQAGPSPVTGKKVPSSANRYYIPGPAGKLAIFTYSSPNQSYDPAGADDFANAFKWLK